MKQQQELRGEISTARFKRQELLWVPKALSALCPRAQGSAKQREQGPLKCSCSWGWGQGQWQGRASLRSAPSGSSRD